MEHGTTISMFSCSTIQRAAYLYNSGWIQHNAQQLKGICYPGIYGLRTFQKRNHLENPHSQVCGGFCRKICCSLKYVKQICKDVICIQKMLFQQFSVTLHVVQFLQLGQVQMPLQTVLWCCKLQFGTTVIRVWGCGCRQLRSFKQHSQRWFSTMTWSCDNRVWFLSCSYYPGQLGFAALDSVKQSFCCS